MERKLHADNESKSKVSMETNLRDFAGILQQDRRAGKKKGMAFHLARCMVGYLYLGNLPGTEYAKLKPVHNVGELYSFAEREKLQSFGHYGRKTWTKLSECLVEYGLPPLKLPQEWSQQS